ncbi:MAG: AmmeMemoRadiSam system protein B [Patescibacteria group bacterium]|jgi:AmmeMemoRadiSam system protein B
MKRLALLSAILLTLTGCARPAKTIETNKNNTSNPGGIVQRSYSMDRAFFDRAFTGNQPVAEQTVVVAGIIPHHLLASHQIARWFDGVQELKPSVVVVVGPNHNEIGNGPILTSNGDWNTPYGILNRDTELIGELVDSGLVNVDERIFTQEHSISAEVSFIKRTWPNTKFVPIILKNTASETNQISLAKQLNVLLPSDALVIASADFSHYLTSDEADRQDAVTLTALTSLNTNRVEEMYVDSKPTMRTVLEYVHLRQSKELVILENTNSAKVTGQSKLSEVTSYFTAYYTK